MGIYDARNRRAMARGQSMRDNSEHPDYYENYWEEKEAADDAAIEEALLQKMQEEEYMKILQINGGCRRGQ